MWQVVRIWCALLISRVLWCRMVVAPKKSRFWLFSMHSKSDLNENLSQNRRPKSPVQIKFANEIKISMQVRRDFRWLLVEGRALTFELPLKVPNQDSKFNFNKFPKKEFKSIDARESRPFNRRSSFVESQTKLSSCSEQFINLIRCVIGEECGIPNGLAASLEKWLGQLPTGEQTKDENNNDQRMFARIDQLIKPETVEELDSYLLRLIATTKSALDENSSQFCPFTDSTGSNFSPTLKGSIRSDSTSSDQPSEPNEADYLNALDKVKLLLYKDQLEQTIQKLSADLVGELEAKDLIYLKRDELFLRIENLTRQW